MEELNRNTSAVIGATSQIIAEDLYDNDRVSIVISNNSAAGQIIYLAIDSEAVVDNGIILNVGGFYSESEDGKFNPTKKRITAISSAVGGKITISERVRVKM